MSVLLDVQGIQSRAHGERGIARYLAELAAAFEEHYPNAVERYLINPDLPVGKALEGLPSMDRIGSVDSLPPDASVYHVGSPFEPDVAIDQIWPRAARRMRLAVTLYDLIPEVFAETYLADPLVRSWYRIRLTLVRHADRVLTISQATADDAVERLGLPADRVVVVGAAPAPRFRAPASPEAALAELRERLPAVEPGFVLYTGGIEFRKNIDRLLVAYASLDASLRREHQLVIVCRIGEAERAGLTDRLRALGIADRVFFTGYVSDEDLVRLYGAAHLFVFPSLYEGYGLPVAEALACGAPVIASDTSSLRELVPDEAARFDPYEPTSIRATIERCLLDPTHLEGLRRSKPRGLSSWKDVARRTSAAYDDLLRRPKVRRARRRLRVAYVSPLPPQRSGVADYSYRLLAPLAGYCDIDAFADMSLGDAQAPAGVHVSAVTKFDVVERIRSGYDCVFVCLGNSEHHAEALGLLHHRGGIALAHDVRLSGLYAFCADRRPDLEHRSFSEALREMYGAQLPPELAKRTWLDPVEADSHGVFMAREAIASADRFIVHSEYAAYLARSDAAPEHRRKIQVAPFAFPDPGEFAGYRASTDTPIIGTFGVVAPVKQTAKVLEGFAVVARHRSDCTLAVVGGPAAAGDLDRVREQAAQLGLSERVVVTGHLDDESFRRFIAGTSVAVQLRSVSMGESPASVAECLAAGVPTIVTALGAARELPGRAVAKVGVDVHPEELGRLMLSLLEDEEKRTRLGEGGRALAWERSFERSARFLYEMIREIERSASQAAA